MTREPYRALPYADPTGNTATALVDAENESRQLNGSLDMNALRDVHETATGHRQGNADKAFTNDMAVRALVALGAQRVSSSALLASHHTPDKEATWEPETTSRTTTEWWDQTSEISES